MMQILMLLFFLGSEMFAPSGAVVPGDWLARKGYALNVPAQMTLATNTGAALSARLLAFSWLAANDAPAAERAVRGLGRNDDPVLLASARALFGRQEPAGDDARWNRALRALPETALLAARLDYARIMDEEPVTRRLAALAGATGSGDTVQGEGARFYGILHAFRVGRLGLSLLDDGQGEAVGLVAVIDGTVSAPALRRIAFENGLTNIVERQAGEFRVLRIMDGIVLAVGDRLSAVVLGRAPDLVNGALENWLRNFSRSEGSGPARGFADKLAARPAFAVARLGPALFRSFGATVPGVEGVSGVEIEFAGLERGQGRLRLEVASGQEEVVAAAIRGWLVRQRDSLPDGVAAAGRWLAGFRVRSGEREVVVESTTPFDFIRFLLGRR